MELQATVGWIEQQFTWSMERRRPYSRRILRLNSLYRTGKGEKSFETATVVPIALATFSWEMSEPAWLYVRRAPTASSLVRVVILTSERAHRELKASPRNPNEDSVCKSEKSEIFDVWYFRVSPCKNSHCQIQQKLQSCDESNK